VEKEPRDKGRPQESPVNQRDGNGVSKRVVLVGHGVVVSKTKTEGAGLKEAR